MLDRRCVVNDDSLVGGSLFTMDRFLDKVEHFILHGAFKYLVVVTWLLCFVKVGIWCMPNEGFFKLAQDPFVNAFRYQQEHYMIWNWLGSFIAWCMGITSFKAFFLLHLSYSLLFTVAMALLLKRFLPNREARLAWVIFTMLPVAWTSYYWVGIDSLTLLLMVVALHAHRYIFWTLVCGVLLGMQHFEQAFFAAGALGFMLLLHDDKGIIYKARFPLTLLVGTLLGRALLTIIFYLTDMKVNAGRLWTLTTVAPMSIRQFFLHPYPVIFSFFGIAWLVVFKYFGQGRNVKSLAFTLFGLTLLDTIVEDQTRVFCIVSFWLVAVCLLLDREFLQALPSRFVAWVALLWVLLPWYWVWCSSVKGPATCYDIYYILDQLHIVQLPKLSILMKRVGVEYIPFL